MIRLNSWHEAVDDQQVTKQRLSDAIESSSAVPFQQLPQAKQTKHIREPEESSPYAVLMKRQKVEDLQFWADFQVYYQQKVVVERCFFVKTTSDSVRFIDDLLKVNGVDETERPITLYLSLRWIMEQSVIPGRPVPLAMKSRSLQGFALKRDDVLCLYDQIKVDRADGPIVIADKFHF